jgi:hypothetical protein
LSGGNELMDVGIGIGCHFFPSLWWLVLSVEYMFYFIIQVFEGAWGKITRR